MFWEGSPSPFNLQPSTINQSTLTRSLTFFFFLFSCGLTNHPKIPPTFGHTASILLLARLNNVLPSTWPLPI
ncbi:hypothetical protein FJTKL_05231 [Diaporthe vaccinii]|uniref:Uncharacterized protein n=1 Tax=Diaporthe vaccinii TaxID=105482 RepID=A0ABR4FFJ9_9PEZI